MYVDVSGVTVENNRGLGGRAWLVFGLGLEVFRNTVVGYCVSLARIFEQSGPAHTMQVRQEDPHRIKKRRL